MTREKAGKNDGRGGEFKRGTQKAPQAWKVYFTLCHHPFPGLELGLALSRPIDHHCRM